MMGKDETPMYVSPVFADWMEKVFRKHDESLYRIKMIRPRFQDAYKTTSEDNRLIHGIKKLDDGN
jgi:hypothetical protein